MTDRYSMTKFFARYSVVAILIGAVLAVISPGAIVVFGGAVVSALIFTPFVWWMEWMDHP